MYGEFVRLNVRKIKIDELASEACGETDGHCSTEASALLANIDSGEKDGYINLIEAHRYFQSKGFSPDKIACDAERRIYSTMHTRFFRDAPFYYTEGVSKRLLLPVEIEELEDGDTGEGNDEAKARIKIRFAGGDSPESIKGWTYCETDQQKLAEEHRQRECTYGGKVGEWATYVGGFCVVDQERLAEMREEKKCTYYGKAGEEIYQKNPKLTNFEDHLLQMWQDDLQISDHWPIRPKNSDGSPLTVKDREKLTNYYEWVTKRMIQDRILYAGSLASAAAKDLNKWLKADGKGGLYGEITYNRSSDDPSECNSMVVGDKYNRYLGRIIVLTDLNGRDLLGEFIKDELSKAMGKGTAEPGGADYYEYFTNDTGLVKTVHGYKTVTPMALDEGKGQRLLEDWENKGHRLHNAWLALSPKTIPNPAEIFSPARCEAMLTRWKQFIERHPQYKEDVLAMLILIGLEYNYPKYRNEHTPVYAEAEKIAIENGFGMWQKRKYDGENIPGDAIMAILRPDPNDQRTLAFKFKNDANYTGHDSRGKPIRLDPEDCSMRRSALKR